MSTATRASGRFHRGLAVRLGSRVKPRSSSEGGLSSSSETPRKIWGNAADTRSMKGGQDENVDMTVARQLRSCGVESVLSLVHFICQATTRRIPPVANLGRWDNQFPPEGPLPPKVKPPAYRELLSGSAPEFAQELKYTAHPSKCHVAALGYRECGNSSPTSLFKPVNH